MKSTFAVGFKVRNKMLPEKEISLLMDVMDDCKFWSREFQRQGNLIK